MSPHVRLRVYLREHAEDAGDGGRPAYEAVYEPLEAAGLEDVSVHRGFMGFDHASEVLNSRPLSFHPDLPVVVEAVGEREKVEALLPAVRAALPRGLITLSEVDLFAPGHLRDGG